MIRPYPCERHPRAAQRARPRCRRPGRGGLATGFASRVTQATANDPAYSPPAVPWAEAVAAAAAVSYTFKEFLIRLSSPNVAKELRTAPLTASIIWRVSPASTNQTGAPRNGFNSICETVPGVRARMSRAETATCMSDKAVTGDTFRFTGKMAML